MSEPVPAVSAEVELARFRHGEGVEDTCEMLRKAGITYRLSTDVPAFDIASIGHGSAQGSMIVMVAADDERKAREALLEDARLAVRQGVSEDFHLRTWLDDDLKDLLKEPMEWSAYDVAAAESLLRERCIIFDPPSYELPETVVAERAGKALRERRGTRVMLARLAVGLALGLAFMILRQRTDEASLRLLTAIRIGGTLWLGWLLWTSMSSDDESDK